MNEDVRDKKKSPFFSAVIPVRNSPQKLRETLKSIKVDADDCFEIIVVDDCSSDETPEVAKEFGVKLIKLEKPFGPAYARNVGSKEAKGDVLIFFDSDVITGEKVLEALFEHFRKDESTKCVNFPTSPEPANKGFCPKYTACFDYISAKRIAKDDTLAQVPVINPRCCGIRKSFYEEMGGFSTFVDNPSVEDTEFCMRLAKKFQDSGEESKIYVDMTQTIRHFYSTSFWAIIKKTYDRGARVTRLCLNQKQVGKGATGAREGLSRILGFLTFLSTISLIIYWKTLP